MEISIIRIRNAKEIRLPKTVLEKYNIPDSVELFLEKGYTILKPKQEPRKGESNFVRDFCWLTNDTEFPLENLFKLWQKK